MRQTFFLLFFFSTVSLLAQHPKVQVGAKDQMASASAATKSSELFAEYLGVSNLESVDKKWLPFLSTVISKNKSDRDMELTKIVEEKLKTKFAASNKSAETAAENASLANAPTLGRNFQGIDNAGTNQPLYNTLAVSNNGFIVTCVNAKIEMYDLNGNLIYTQSLRNFINNTSISTNLCDPKIIYDSGAERFIFFAQTCDGLAASSKIIVGFSKEEDPTNGFNIYTLSGNPLNNNTWFDYPKIGVSTNELFITGNLFGSNGGTFNQAIVFQINKAAGFGGGNLNYQYWNNLNGTPFTLMPLTNGHQGNYGPGIYLISTAGATAGSTSANLYEITDEISATNEQIKHYIISTTTYSVGGNAKQKGSTKLLKTNDCRTLDGFYLNGMIHYVLHGDIGNGYNGILYNRLNLKTLVNSTRTFGLSGTYDYCFPSIASTSTSMDDHSVLIAFSRSGATLYPESRVVYCDHNLNWSNSTSVRDGENTVTYSWNSDNTERWGDYTSAARKQNENPPRIWVAGEFGNAKKYWGQWIAEVMPPVFNSSTNNVRNEHSLKVNPNPIVDLFRVEFVLEQSETIRIDIIDLQGKIVRELHRGEAQLGMNIFSFNKAALSTGEYILHIQGQHKTIKNEKISVH
ncbi:MAG: T9SS type A sorting domain-containing protein [Bacteroidetes bacterium]|nr:T9SS type A sorting domain-containing protein [Bacteroidota bacterium]